MVTERPERHRIHLVAGGYPVGNPAGHDHDYARLRLLEMIEPHEHVHTTVAGDFFDLEKWLPGSDFLITYTAGPVPDDDQTRVLSDWIEAGGRWLALHGSSGGRARRQEQRPGLRQQRRMMRMQFHDILGGFFINHPPVRRFRVDVANRDHALTRGLPASFVTVDEPYMIEVQESPDTEVLLTARLGPDNSPPGFGFIYDEDTALLPDGKTRVLGYVRRQGRGAVTYIALGHCHTPTTVTQPFVEENVAPGGVTPPVLRGSWETRAFPALLRNAIAWGIEPR